MNLACKPNLGRVLFHWFSFFSFYQRRLSSFLLLHHLPIGDAGWAGPFFLPLFLWVKGQSICPPLEFAALCPSLVALNIFFCPLTTGRPPDHEPPYEQSSLNQKKLFAPRKESLFKNPYNSCLFFRELCLLLAFFLLFFGPGGSLLCTFFFPFLLGTPQKGQLTPVPMFFCLQHLPCRTNPARVSFFFSTGRLPSALCAVPLDFSFLPKPALFSVCFFFSLPPL